MRATALVLAALLLTAPSVASADGSKECDDAFEQSQVKRDDGKLIEARRLLRACSAPTCSRTQQKLCSQWLDDVGARVPSVVLSAKDGAGGDIVDVSVTMDSMQIATRLDGRTVDVDPGPHTFVFVAPNGARAETKALVEERGKGKLVSVRIDPLPPVATLPVAPPPAVSAAGSGGGALRTSGFVMGGVGVAGLAIGTIFGALALATKASDCQGGECNPGTSATAYRQGTVSTVGFVAGGVLVAGGVTLVLVGRARDVRDVKEGVSVGVAPLAGSVTGLRVVGRW